MCVTSILVNVRRLAGVRTEQRHMVVGSCTVARQAVNGYSLVGGGLASGFHDSPFYLVASVGIGPIGGSISFLRIVLEGFLPHMSPQSILLRAFFTYQIEWKNEMRFLMDLPHCSG